jgi:hypothetical protein
MEEVRALAQAAGLPLPQERAPLLAASLPMLWLGRDILLSLHLGEEGPAAVFKAPATT